ncbi:hypothetical protein [Xanthomonas graminis]|uniref:Uncharacterized protein n=1 Tax=Xanthomonas graminis pv. poae TaxID=227946 RepID=A0A199P6W2_9XANT|nr:hypothetical protein [Xanthomonas translucens]OAX57024.1 hypothetical protein A6R73_11445 [Xanthomonas translucens pv. poae]
MSAALDREPAAYVEKADAAAIRVRAMRDEHDAALRSIGFAGTGEAGVYAMVVRDDAEKAKAFHALRELGLAFAAGREWCPAEVFGYLRDKGLLSGPFLRIAWTQPGRYRLQEA